MDAENMTADELIKLAAAKRGEETQTITVNGRDYTVYPKRLLHWKAFNLIAAIDDADNTEFQKVSAALEFVSYVTDTTAQEFIDGLGGDTANMMDVMAVCAEIIQAVAPKN